MYLDMCQHLFKDEKPVNFARECDFLGLKYWLNRDGWEQWKNKEGECHHGIQLAVPVPGKAVTPASEFRSV